MPTHPSSRDSFTHKAPTLHVLKSITILFKLFFLDKYELKWISLIKYIDIYIP